jgi:hypothetical protein
MTMPREAERRAHEGASDPVASPLRHDGQTLELEVGGVGRLDQLDVANELAIGDRDQHAARGLGVRAAGRSVS